MLELEKASLKHEVWYLVKRARGRFPLAVPDGGFQFIQCERALVEIMVWRRSILEPGRSLK